MKIYDENQFNKSKLDERERGNSLGLEDNIHTTSVDQATECIRSFFKYGFKLLEGQTQNEYGELEIKKENISIGNINNIKQYSLEIDDNYIYLDMRFKVLPDKEFTKADLLLANTDDYEVQKKLTKNGVKKVRIKNNTSACRSENGKIFGYKILSLNVQIILEQ